MKKSLLLYLMVVSSALFAQQEMVFYDEIYKTAIPKVKVHNVHGDFIGLSNKQGKIAIANESYPISYERFGYESATINGFIDTVMLTPTYQEIEEVVIKPVNKMELYNEIIQHSNSLLDKSTGDVKGVYFESVMVVHPAKKDTVYLDNICDLILRKRFDKKKVDYQFYCDNGIRNYLNNASKEMQDFDTSLLNTCLKFVQPFKKNLKYDLTNTKNYKLKFEESEIKRTMGAELDQLLFKNSDKYLSKVEVSYKEMQLFSWDNQMIRYKPYHGEKIFVNYKKAGRYIEFTEGEPYYFNTMIVNGLVQIAVEGDFYEIYVVKGFMRDESVNFEISESHKEVEDYLEGIAFTKDGVARYYTFETEKEQ